MNIRRKINERVKFLSNKKYQILALAYNDFKSKYAGSYFGFIWGFIQPLISILIYWFVFQVGFKSGNRPDGTPYALWLVCGIIPWTFFAESISNATTSFTDYSYLVKKVVFDFEIIPLIRIVSSFFVHMFFVIIIILMSLLYGYNIRLCWIQVFYYMFCSLILISGVSKIVATLNVFIKDIPQIVVIIIQFLFWLTPIVWTNEMFSKNIQLLLKLNPVFYIIQGYRDCFTGNAWFFQRYKITIYFWLISTFIFVIGRLLFKKLKPHFSDVL